MVLHLVCTCVCAGFTLRRPIPRIRARRGGEGGGAWAPRQIIEAADESACGRCSAHGDTHAGDACTGIGGHISSPSQRPRRGRAADAHRVGAFAGETRAQGRARRRAHSRAPATHMLLPPQGAPAASRRIDIAARKSNGQNYWSNNVRVSQTGRLFRAASPLAILAPATRPPAGGRINTTVLIPDFTPDFTHDFTPDVHPTHTPCRD
jgi:type II secretory pathway pseudopilin PulG